MYHYEECGLKDVWLADGYTLEQDDTYGDLLSIHDMEQLHRAIGLHIVETTPILTNDQIRFLRKEMNLSQKNLAGLLSVNETTIRNWESTRTPMATAADRLLRSLYKEHANENGKIRAMIEKLNAMDVVSDNPSKMNFTYGQSHAWHAADCR